MWLCDLLDGSPLPPPVAGVLLMSAFVLITLGEDEEVTARAHARSSGESFMVVGLGDIVVSMRRRQAGELRAVIAEALIEQATAGLLVPEQWSADVCTPVGDES